MALPRRSSKMFTPFLGFYADKSQEVGIAETRPAPRLHASPCGTSLAGSATVARRQRAEMRSSCSASLSPLLSNSNLPADPSSELDGPAEEEVSSLSDSAKFPPSASCRVVLATRPSFRWPSLALAVGPSAPGIRTDAVTTTQGPSRPPLSSGRLHPLLTGTRSAYLR